MTFNEWWEEMQPILGNKSKADAKWAWNACAEEAAKVAEDMGRTQGYACGIAVSRNIRSLKEE